MRNFGWIVSGLIVCFGVAVWAGLIVPVMLEYLPALFVAIIGFGVPAIVLIPYVASLISRRNDDGRESGKTSEVPKPLDADISPSHHPEDEAGITTRSSLPEPLSTRECEVLGLLSAGKTNREIAHALFVEVGTVKTHTNNIYRKLGVRHRAEAVAKAHELELL